MAPIGSAVFATLLMNDAYLPGAMVLGHSLRDRRARTKLVVLVTVDKVSSETIEELKTVYDDIVPVQQIVNKQPANLFLMNRPDLISTFTKIELWRQTQYKRIIYLDADMVALRAPNELLTLDTNFAAVPDIGWPDCFNSGMMVLNPNMGDYYSLLALAQRGISFDGADQGLLNMHFREWERLSFTYNCTPSGNYQYLPAYRHFQSSINMVHFIGPDKPWTLGRENKFNSGVYGELLGMWWAVYDKHYRSQPATYYSGQSSSAPKKVQDHVRGEQAYVLPGYSSIPPQQVSAQSQTPSIVVEPPSGEGAAEVPAERPMGDAPTPTEQVIKNDFKPTPTVEQRRFSAPHVEWEPSRAPPPVHSKPEAANFPTTIYDMSSDTNLFQPPTKYPDAPKDMWYQVPEKVPEAPKPQPIFPWETRAPKPTRVFPQAKAPSPPPEPEPEPEAQEEDVTTPSAATDVSHTTEESVPTPTIASPDPWAAFQSRTNAWDDMPEIERYMQSLQQARFGRGKVQVLHQTPASSTDVTSPGAEPGRRPSLKVTDFPTEFERPSLPVTPAPIRRPSFWGEEREESENFPAAEGVPKQEEWNPVARLEDLQRKQSEVLMSPNGLPRLEEVQSPPDRKMPESNSLDEAIEAATKAASPVTTTARPKAPKPILKEPHFELEKDDASAADSPSKDSSAKGLSFSPVTLVGQAATTAK